jgi:hypothetical protein
MPIIAQQLMSAAGVIGFDALLRLMLAPSDRIPEATVWLAPREPAAIPDLVADGHALFVFFLFAWSST